MSYVTACFVVKIHYSELRILGKGCINPNSMFSKAVRLLTSSSTLHCQKIKNIAGHRHQTLFCFLTPKPKIIIHLPCNLVILSSVYNICKNEASWECSVNKLTNKSSWIIALRWKYLKQ